MKLEITYRTSEMFKSYKGYIQDNKLNNRNDLIQQFISSMYGNGFNEKIKVINIKEVE